MTLFEVIWREKFVDKVAQKHGVTTQEVEDVLFKRPVVRFIEKGRVAGENLYVAYGQTSAGRYLVVFFIHKFAKAALPISARDMTRAERRYYNEKTQAR